VTLFPSARLWKRLGVSCASGLLFLGVAEWSVETFCYVPARRAPIAFWGRNDDAIQLEGPGSAFEPNDRWFWQPRPGAQYVNETINEDGYRGERFPLARGARFRIVTLGDSSTMGYGVSEREAWPRRLEAILREGGREAEVLNLGVVGFTSLQGLLYYEGKAKEYDPDLVIAAFGAFNDAAAAEEGLTDAAKLAIFESASYRAREFFRRFTLVRWMETWRSAPGPNASEAAQPGAAQPGNSAHSDKTASRPAPRPRVSPAELESNINKIAAGQRARGKQFLLVCPPRTREAEREFPATVEYTAALHRAATAAGAPLADVYDEFRAREDAMPAPGSPESWYLDFVHPSVRGHQEYASIVAKLCVSKQWPPATGSAK
jgi:lysophospholipase L1-like esterase